MDNKFDKNSFTPYKYFCATDLPSKDFNSEVEEALKTSYLYFFKGVTGRYVPIRIQSMVENIQPMLNCRVLLVDPRATNLLWCYAKDRHTKIYNQAMHDFLITQTKKEIFMTLVALFDICKLISIEIKMYTGLVYYRMEIFDSKIFVSFFNNQRTAFPYTLVYEKNSFFYEIYLKDFNQTFDEFGILNEKILFNSQTKEIHVVNLLRDLGWDEKLFPLAKLREDYNEFKTNFQKQIGAYKPMKRGTISSKNLIQHMEVPDKNGKTFGKNKVYILGCYEKRVTVVSQQIRALNLIYSLIKEEKVRKGASLAIIGAGIAGLTAAIGAAYKGVDVTLFEYRNGILDIFDNNAIRWLHPHVYDWPEDNSEIPNAGLPLMNWSAGTVRQVVDQLRNEWSNYLDRWKNISDKGKINSIEKVSGISKPDINIDLTENPMIRWNSPGYKQQKFDAVILAVGFGKEETKDNLPITSYWSSDTFENTNTECKSFLVSGCGDGGLTDLLRVSIKDFRHENILQLLPDLENHAGKKLKQGLLEIEKQAWSKYDDSDWLYQQYTELLSEDNIKPLFEQIKDKFEKDKRLRKDTKVTLNGESKSPLTLKASILNRFLTFCLLSMGTSYISGRLDKVKKQSNSYEVTFEDGSKLPFDEVIIRFGPTPAIDAFPNITKTCEPLKHRNEMDETRWPIWEDNFFGNPL